MGTKINGITPESATPKDHCKVTDLFAATQPESQQNHSTHNGPTQIGLLNVDSVNNWLLSAAKSPMPQAIWGGIIYEKEVTCLFSDTNTGKTILAVQIAEEVATCGRNSLYVDFELSKEQFYRRYCNIDTGEQHEFPDNMYRAEITQYPDTTDFAKDTFDAIKESCLAHDIEFVVIDNLSWINNNAEKAEAAAQLMKDLISLKRDMGLTLLVISHTPKRYLNQPITQNDLAGSKQIINFLDAALAISKSVKDPHLRYIKQVKVRSAAYTYDSNNVLVCEIVQEGTFLKYKEVGTSPEYEHLHERCDNQQLTNDILELHRQGKSSRQIGDALGIDHMKAYRTVIKNNCNVTHTSVTGVTSDTGGQSDELHY